LKSSISVYFSLTLSERGLAAAAAGKERNEEENLRAVVAAAADGWK
jgi:hypothetical protein